MKIEKPEIEITDCEATEELPEPRIEELEAEWAALSCDCTDCIWA